MCRISDGCAAETSLLADKKRVEVLFALTRQQFRLSLRFTPALDSYNYGSETIKVDSYSFKKR